MTKDQVKAILDRDLTWSSQRQQGAAELLMLIEKHDQSPYRLNGEQMAELRERIADDDAPTLSELDERLRRLGA